jgi:pyrroloquinoline quinone (PQQ) biosynthesis protein C
LTRQGKVQYDRAPPKPTNNAIISSLISDAYAELAPGEKAALPKLRAIQLVYAKVKQDVYPVFLQQHQIVAPQDPRAAEKLRKKLMSTQDWVEAVQTALSSSGDLTGYLRGLIPEDDLIFQEQ